MAYSVWEFPYTRPMVSVVWKDTFSQTPSHKQGPKQGPKPLRSQTTLFLHNHVMETNNNTFFFIVIRDLPHDLIMRQLSYVMSYIGLLLRCFDKVVGEWHLPHRSVLNHGLDALGSIKGDRGDTLYHLRFLQLLCSMNYLVSSLKSKRLLSHEVYYREDLFPRR